MFPYTTVATLLMWPSSWPDAVLGRFNTLRVVLAISTSDIRVSGLSSSSLLMVAVVVEVIVMRVGVGVTGFVVIPTEFDAGDRSALKLKGYCVYGVMKL